MADIKKGEDGNIKIWIFHDLKNMVFCAVS